MSKIYNYKVNDWNISIARSLTSTMDEIKKPKYDNIENTLLMSFLQVNGRGRQNNKWISELGNLFFSINYKFFNNSKIFLINYLCGIVIYDVIKSFLKDSSKLFLKWPNDIFLNDRKIGGILIETQSNGNKLSNIYIGVGINLKKSPINLEYKTTSLREQGVKRVSKKEFINRLTSAFSYWEDYLKDNNISYILKSWMNRSWKINSKISFKNNNKKLITGLYKGINEDGSISITVKEKTLNYFTLEVL